MRNLDKQIEEIRRRYQEQMCAAARRRRMIQKGLLGVCTACFVLVLTTVAL